MTPAMLQELVAAVASLPMEPVSAWMREHGCDPAAGWVMLVPERFRANFRTFVPECVRFSPLVQRPAMINAPELGRFHAGAVPV